MSISLEWDEHQDHLYAKDSTGHSVTCFEIQHFDELLNNHNFGPGKTVSANMLCEINHNGSEVCAWSHEIHEVPVKEVVEIIRARKMFIDSIARKRERNLVDGMRNLFDKNGISHCYQDFLESIGDFIENQSRDSIFMKYLEFIIGTYDGSERTNINFYIDELDFVEDELFNSD